MPTTFAENLGKVACIFGKQTQHAVSQRGSTRNSIAPVHVYIIAYLYLPFPSAEMNLRSIRLERVQRC
jgi:hypothetical protein